MEIARCAGWGFIPPKECYALDKILAHMSSAWDKWGSDVCRQPKRAYASATSASDDSEVRIALWFEKLNTAPCDISRGVGVEGVTPAQHGSRSSATLPVLPFSLPSPQAFTILHPYMYTHRLDAALAGLLPLLPAFLETLAPGPSTDAPHARVSAALSSRSAIHALAAHLAASAGGSLSALMAHARHVKELWQDMVALGLYDAELWDALDLAWEVVLAALNLAAAQ
ncbi:hypothetical protein FB45DRAFT_1033806 [Roridomyces roridus]|uniref:Uncharacterized protein n=1 Tax=Roridomyces roridus TaxID=1738132 RepID=A0AAD7BEK2_9AGAR|nr:hypothetical protein FB45DRAFT_1033806 [Roridomyces roridus]